MQAARLWSASWALGEWRRWCGERRTAAAAALEQAAGAKAAEDSREAVARRMLLRLRTRHVFSSWANYLAVRDERGRRACLCRANFTPCLESTAVGSRRFLAEGVKWEAVVAPHTP